tara:strand:- start:228 stop:401 length:174 start_codon:yes stop_codon:yes gene_type:complete
VKVVNTQTNPNNQLVKHVPLVIMLVPVSQLVHMLIVKLVRKGVTEMMKAVELKVLFA